MRPPARITLSWDDGHPLDARVADLMARHNLRGTFYIPRSAVRGTMSIAQIRDLASAFEVGAHTLDHVVLTKADDRRAWNEIHGAKAWLEDVTGRPCHLFCPPAGRYARRHLRMVERAGYHAIRTVELMSLEWPRPRGALLSMPTSVQAWPHDARSYIQNAVKRGAVRNLWRYIVNRRSHDWLALSRALLTETLRRGGVFHLWAHSWEIEDSGAWGRLEELMRLLKDVAEQAPALTNGEICRLLAASQRTRREEAPAPLVLP